MKTKYYSIIILVILLSAVENSFSQPWIVNLQSEKQNDFREVQKSFNEYWEGKEIVKGNGWKQFKRWEYFWEQRIWGKWEFPTVEQVQNAYTSAKIKSDNISLQGQIADWKEFGPVTVPQNLLYYKSSGIGRINCIRFHPSNQDVIWAGSSNGGLWRSLDAGLSWQLIPIADVWSIGISDVAMAQSNPNIMYVATGDANGAFMSKSYSVGVYKSTDAGNTWMPTKLLHNKNASILAGSVVVSPYNSNVVFAGTSLGLYKSDNGGQDWTVMIPTEFIKEVKYKIGDPNIMYATTLNAAGNCNIYKSKDAGKTWAVSLALANANRITIGLTSSRANYIYALASNRYNNGFLAFYRSTDAGEKWEQMSNSPNILGLNADGSSSGGQGNYDLAIAVHPSDPNVVYIGGIQIWKTNNGGTNWTLVSHWTGDMNLPYVHADQQDLHFSSNGKVLYSANDGGLYSTDNFGASWTDLTSGMGIQQFYRCGISESNSGLFIGGTQDNGTQLYKNGKWSHIMGGDGMDAAIDPVDPNILYGSFYNGFFQRSDDGGKNFKLIIQAGNVQENGSWVTPFIIDPNKSSVIYTGYANVYKSTDRGDSWKKISSFSSYGSLSCLAVAPGYPGVVYASAYDRLYCTPDSGKTWSMIRSGGNAITSIEIDPKNPFHAWVSLSGYDTKNKVQEYIPADKKWVDMSAGLPALPANVVVFQKNSPDGNLFVGTDIGVYYKNSSMNEWQAFNKGMPNVAISDMQINYGSGKLVAATYGRGAWETKIIDCNIEKPSVETIGSLSFCSGDSIKLKVNNSYPIIEWSNGVKGNEVTIKTSGTYRVIVKDDKGCTSVSDDIIVNVYSIPNLKIRTFGKEFGCGADSVVLGTAIGFVRFNWSNGDTNKTTTVWKPGDYSVRAYTNKGCSKESEAYKVSYYENSEKPGGITFTGDSLIATTGNSYQWYFEGLPIDGKTSRAIKPVKSGLYQVGVATNTLCFGISDPYSFVNSVAEENAGIKIEISPNPASGMINIKATIEKIAGIEIIITDVGGRQVYNETLPVSAGSIDKNINLESLESGIYFIGIRVGSDFYVRKMSI